MRSTFVISITILSIIAAAAAVLAMYFFLGVALLPSIVDGTLSVILYALISLSFKYQTRYIKFSKKKLWQFFITHAVNAVFASLAWFGFTSVLLNLIALFTDMSLSFFHDTFLHRILIGSLLYFIMIAFRYMFQYYDSYNTQVKREAELRSLITEAELKTLKFQINPHFIFNSLNSIAALTSLDPQKAREMTIKLSEFMRFTLSKNLRSTNKLSEELENIHRYLEIEKVRFPDKFTYDENIAGECLDVEVPNMILQPVFENAIKHGVYDAIEPVTITLNCTPRGNAIELLIENNYDDDSVPVKGAGVGLENIRERLQLIYRMQNLLKVQKKDGKFSVRLTIPVPPEETADEEETDE